MTVRRRTHCSGFSLVELLIVIAIIAAVLAIAIPNVIGAYLNVSETAVMREMQTIHQAQLQYLSQFGDYAASLAELGPPANGLAGPRGAKLIPASLASGVKNGYVFTLAKLPSGFTVNANPKPGGNGRRTFYIDQDGVLHQNWGSERPLRTARRFNKGNR